MLLCLAKNHSKATPQFSQKSKVYLHPLHQGGSTSHQTSWCTSTTPLCPYQIHQTQSRAIEGNRITQAAAHGHHQASRSKNSAAATCAGESIASAPSTPTHPTNPRVPSVDISQASALRKQYQHQGIPGMRCFGLVTTRD